jgi:hypothetical protein
MSINDAVYAGVIERTVGPDGRRPLCKVDGVMLLRPHRKWGELLCGRCSRKELYVWRKLCGLSGIACNGGP